MERYRNVHSEPSWRHVLRVTERKEIGWPATTGGTLDSTQHKPVDIVVPSAGGETEGKPECFLDVILCLKPSHVCSHVFLQHPVNYYCMR